MPIPAAVVRLLNLQPDDDDPSSMIMSWSYRLYFCGIDVEEQGDSKIPDSFTQAQIKDEVNAKIVASAQERGFQLSAERIMTSSNICGV
jgi:hypothetical protein